MRVQLVPLEGGTSIDVTKDLMLVGRKEDCDIQLDHKSISKQHCIIVRTDGLLLLRDLGSTNGTRVNGQRVRRAAILPNDQLNIASLRFKVKFSEEEEPAASPEEYTQQMDLAEIEKVIKKTAEEANEEDDSMEDMSLPPMQNNALPDVYEEKASKKKK
ncbi:MAG: FHA domain-containing protein [Planctomycetes bacterium]|nr:FHA domain-containing protein [Planctomycetota bacterium]